MSIVLYENKFKTHINTSAWHIELEIPVHDISSVSSGGDGDSHYTKVKAQGTACVSDAITVPLICGGVCIKVEDVAAWENINEEEKVCTSVSVCMYECMSVCMHACMYVYKYICLYVCI